MLGAVVSASALPTRAAPRQGGSPTQGSEPLSTQTAARLSAQAAKGAALPSLARLLGPARVIAYIKETIDWYERVQSLEARPRFVRYAEARARLESVALSTLRLSFHFGHALAAVPSYQAHPSGTPSAMGPVSPLEAVASRGASRITALESELSRIDEQLARAPVSRKRTLRAERDALTASLELERQMTSAAEALQRFQSSTLVPQLRGAPGLEGQIDNLEHMAPQALQSPVAANAVGTPVPQPGEPSHGAPRTRAAIAAQPAAAAAAIPPESAGILTLVDDWIGLQNDRRLLNDAAAATRALRRQLDAIQAPLSDAARRLVPAATPTVERLSVAQLKAEQRSLDAAAVRFKDLSALLGPLAEQSLTLADAQGVLNQWAESLAATQATVARFLLTRVAFLLALVVLVFVVSEVVRRALFRYVRDPRRRSHFQTLRRVTVGVAIALVLVFGLVSEIGSLATYVGFLTAGLAVALQNVILAVVAYFLLIGRYGVRIGDRITLAGVTGRVAEIGLIRIYLLEVTGQDLRPTGRLVVLSNAVLFQPQAMFKQIPGVDYVWHGISLTIAGSADVAAAQKRLQSAAEAVYERYGSRIDKQHAAARDLVEFETAKPWPEVRARYTEPGFKFEVRYPVESEQAVMVDREMLEALKASLAMEPALPMAASGEPALDTATG